MAFFNAVLAYLHFGAMMSLAALVVAELLLLGRGLDAKAMNGLWRVDLAYVCAGVLALLSGGARFGVGVSAKGVAFYGGNVLFWLKLLLFAALAFVSIMASRRYGNWLHLSRMDLSFHAPVNEVASALLLLKIQITLIVLIPLLAVLMARGISS